MVDELGNQVKDAPPSKPVEVLGFSKLPTIGAVIFTQPQIAPELKEVIKQAKPTIEADLIAAMAISDKKKLKMILKADTAGSAEAIRESLPKEGIDILRTELGDISEADILDAKASGAVVVGFNLKLSSNIEKLARVEKVIVRTYRIIYELIKELTEVAEGMEEVLFVERELGGGVIIAEFPYEDTRIAGTKITSGRLARGDTVRIMRGESEIARAKIKSMRKGRDDVTKVEAGVECGVQFDKKVDFTLQDGIIAVTIG
jgi:translation initiation factor IF-2